MKPIARQRAFLMSPPIVVARAVRVVARALCGANGAAKGVLLAALLSGAAAVSVAQTTGRGPKYFEDALVRFEKKDTAGAIIQLKNALQQDPKLLAAYVLLGRAQLAEGDAAAAEDAFARALQLGVDRSEVAVPMAGALFGQGKYAALLERFPPTAAPPAARADLLVVRGNAYQALGNGAEAKRAYEAARAADPRNMPALLALAELAALQGKRAEAEALTKEAIALAPKDPRPWHFRGTLALASGDTRGALEAIARAIALEERYVDPRITRASILIDLGRLDEAETDLASVALQRPAEPRAMYLRAIVLSKRGDDNGARDALRDVARAIDPVPRDVLKQRAPEYLVLGGLAHHGLNAQEKARRYFEDYIALRPRDVAARRLLASILIAQGYMQDAISVLETARKDAPGDPQVLALLALGHMGRKQYQLASGYLEDALKTSGESPEIRATLGFSVLGSGQSDLGLDHLERAFKKDSGQVHVGTALTVLYLRRGQPKRAVEVAEEVARQQPKNVLALNLLGAARAGVGDRRGARTAYENALALDRAFVPAQLNLGRLESADGNPDAARRRFEAILQAQPKNAQAMLELAALEEAARRPAEAIRWLEKLRSLDHRNVKATSRLVDVYLSTRAVDKALEVAKDTEARVPENLDALAALARAYLAVGNAKAAQTVLNRMSRLAGFDPEWQTRIARSQLAAGNAAGAVFSLEKALSGRPGYVPAEALLAEVELQSGEVAKAEQRARGIVKRVPDDPAGPRLLADIAMARKRYPEAIENYGRALAKEQTTAAALRLYRAYLNSGSVGAGNEFMESWLKSRPEDVLARRALAEGYLRAGNLAAARARYEEVLKREGDDPVVLNNLAYLLLAEKDVRAREYAEKAHRLAPTDPAIQGTLGWVLVNQGQVEAGLRQLREARLRDPQDPEIRYHLADALARTGRRDEARVELEEALKRGVPFNGIADARKLMAELSSR